MTQLYFYQVQCSADSLAIYIFYEDHPSTVALISKILNDNRFYTHVLKHKPQNDIQICEWESACPFFNSTLKITRLWQLSAIGIIGTFSVEEGDMF